MSNNDDYKLQTMLDSAEPQEYWFSRQNQNKMVLDFASRLVVADSEISTEDAINTAQELIDTFYEQVLQKTTKNYKG